MRKGETKPPKPFTEATLLAAMEHASRFVDDKDLKEALDDDESHSGGIGTPATRAEVIEKLIQSEYVKLKGKQLRSILTGRNLITVVSPELRNVEYTARMEQKLSQVERGERSTLEVMNLFRKEVAGIPRQVGGDRQAERGRHSATTTESGDRIIWTMAKMRPTGHPKRQILAMLDQQTRKTIRRHMADSQRLRLETLPNHLQQKPHRSDGANSARKVPDPRQRFHLTSR